MKREKKRKKTGLSSLVQSNIDMETMGLLCSEVGESGDSRHNAICKMVHFNNQIVP